MKKNEAKPKASAAKKLRAVFSLAWGISPSYLIMLVLSSVLSGAQLLLTIILPRYIIDELSGANSVTTLFLLTSALVGSNLVINLAVNALRLKKDVASAYMSEMFRERLAYKIMSIGYANLENPKMLDLKERAAFALSNFGSVESLMSDFSEFLKDAVIIAGSLAILFTLSPLLVLALALCVAASVLIYGANAIYMRRFFEDLVPMNRKFSYYINTAFDIKLQKDARLYDMGKLLSGSVSRYSDEIMANFRPFFKRLGRLLGLTAVINDFETAIAYGFVGYRVLVPASSFPVTLGSFTMYVSAATSFATTVTAAITAAVNISQSLGYLDPFMELMALPDETESMGGGENGVKFEGSIDSIEFERVTFTYPGAEKAVLMNVSFDVKRGEKVSIVGLNGAGKTTLIKLLSGFYKPDSGRILINGRDLYEYDRASWLASVAAVFQDFKLFSFTIDENITTLDPGADLIGTGEALRKAGLEETVSALDQGIYSLVGRSLDEHGVELSGGQQQKVAIARALYKRAGLVILDEPTSALDPIAEAEIYERFNSLIGNGTAIYISHRMSSSVFCDRILVLDAGAVADFAPHAELMAKENGLYRKLFLTQAENYKLDSLEPVGSDTEQAQV